MKILDKIFKRKRNLKYYAKKYAKVNIDSVRLCRLVPLDKKKKPKYAVFVNEGDKRSYSDWLRYIGSYDIMFLLNDDLEIEQIETDVILDVSPFTDGERYVFEKPLQVELGFDEEHADKTKWQEIKVWNI